MPARPGRYDAAADPNGFPWPAAAAGPAAGVARGEDARGERGGRREGIGAEAVTLSRLAVGGSLFVPIVPTGAPGVRGGLPGPAAARPATVPPAMARQAPSIASTTRMGARGGLDPEPECLPLIPETDVLTTIPIASLASALPGGLGEG